MFNFRIFSSPRISNFFFLPNFVVVDRENICLGSELLDFKDKPTEAMLNKKLKIYCSDTRGS